MSKRPKKPKTLQQFLIPKLRRISQWWPEIAEARKRARVEVPDGKYKNGNDKFVQRFLCAHCENLFPVTEVEVDHREPILNLHGFTTWDDLITGLFCSADKLDVLCLECHQVKTVAEKELAKYMKQQRKEQNKKNRK